MCYYNGIRVSYQEFIQLKGMEKQLNRIILANSITNGFEYGNVPILKPNEAYCDWEIVQMEWGFIPSYLRNREAVEKFRKGYKSDRGFQPPMVTLNAKGEELLLPGKMFREAALKRRCLFLSSGFVEYRHMPKIGVKGKELKEKEKFPYHIRVKGPEVFYIAGIWQEWIDQDTGEKVETCALVTTEANSLMRQIHNSKNRMPCMLDEELAGGWISDNLTEADITAIATHQIKSKDMEAWTIGKDYLSKLEQSEPVKHAGVPELVWN